MHGVTIYDSHPSMFMKCILLAGGKGTRLQPLTDHTPKPLLDIHGKPAIAYTLEALPEEISSIVIAVKHLGQNIKTVIGKTFGKRRVSYVDLIALRGTMDALRQCKKHVKGPTLVLYGDDIYSKEDLATLIASGGKFPAAWHMLVTKVAGQQRFGQVQIQEGRIAAILEVGDPAYQQSGDAFTNAGAYLIDERIFRYKPVKIPNGEYGLPQTIMQAKADIPLVAVPSSCWIPLNTFEDYENAKRILKR